VTKNDKTGRETSTAFDFTKDKEKYSRVVLDVKKSREIKKESIAKGQSPEEAMDAQRAAIVSESAGPLSEADEATKAYSRKAKLKHAEYKNTAAIAGKPAGEELSPVEVQPSKKPVKPQTARVATSGSTASV
jgi:hypothetical protein